MVHYRLQWIIMMCDGTKIYEFLLLRIRYMTAIVSNDIQVHQPTFLFYGHLVVGGRLRYLSPLDQNTSKLTRVNGH